MSNTGKSIKNMGTAVQIIGTIASIICAIALWVQGAKLADSYSTEATSGFVIFMGFVFLVLGILISISSGLFIIGFGELVESNNDINYKLGDIKKEMTEIKETGAESNRKFSKMNTTLDSAIAPSQPTAPSTNDTIIAEMWKCPKCGNFNFADKDECMNCHTTAPSTNDTIIAEPVMQQQPQMWKCPKCGNFNFADKDECMNCHTKVVLRKQ